MTIPKRSEMETRFGLEPVCDCPLCTACLNNPDLSREIIRMARASLTKKKFKIGGK